MITPQDISTFVNQHWDLIIGAIITIIVTVIGALWIENRKEQKPHYAIRNNNVINDLDSKFENLEMHYLKNGVQKNKISDLTVTKIIFWNEGETIDQNDVTTSKPLCIRVKGQYKIFDPKIIYSKKDENLFTVVPSGNDTYVDVNFEYVAKGEGVVIQLLHNCKCNDDIILEGTFKKCQLKRRHLEKTKKVVIPFTKQEKKFDFKPVSLYICGFFVIIPVMNDYLNNKIIPSELYPAILAFIFLGILIYNHSKTRTPDGFESYGEDI